MLMLIANFSIKEVLVHGKRNFEKMLCFSTSNPSLKEKITKNTAYILFVTTLLG